VRPIDTSAKHAPSLEGIEMHQGTHVERRLYRMGSIRRT
jgi:hypothetical protein